MKRYLPLLVAALAAGCGQPERATLQGYVEGEYVRVAAPFAGTLVQLDVARGAQVQAGAPLFALESENETAARKEAQDRLRHAQAQLDNARKGLRPSELEALRAQLGQAQATAGFSAKDYERTADLVAKGFLSPQKLDEAKSARERDRLRVAELQAQLRTAHLGSRPDEVRSAQADVAAAQASLDQADWALRQKTVASTVSGLVTDTNFVRGRVGGGGRAGGGAAAAGERQGALLRARGARWAPCASASRSRSRATGARRRFAAHVSLHRAAGRIHPAGDLQPREPRQARVPGRGAARRRRRPDAAPGPARGRDAEMTRAPAVREAEAPLAIDVRGPHQALRRTSGRRPFLD